MFKIYFIESSYLDGVVVYVVNSSGLSKSILVDNIWQCYNILYTINEQIWFLTKYKNFQQNKTSALCLYREREAPPFWRELCLFIQSDSGWTYCVYVPMQTKVDSVYEGMGFGCIICAFFEFVHL